MKATMKGAILAVVASFGMAIALAILEIKFPANYTAGYWIATGTFALGAAIFWWEKKTGGSSFSFRR